MPLSPRLLRLWSACRSSLATLAGDVAIVSLMYRKPRLIALWLTSARKAQVTLGIAVLGLVLVAPPMLTWLADQLYPTSFEQTGFFQRVFDTSRPVVNPLRDVRYGQFLMLFWVVGLGAATIVLLNHAPATVVIGRDRADALAAEAARLAEADPEQSVRLLRIADGLRIDDDPTRDAVASAAGGKSRAVEKTQVIRRSGQRETGQTRIGADGRYRLDCAIGSGGMGVVHAGTDTLLKRRVALKQLFAHLVDDEDQSSRFRQEALALASLSHPHIVTIHDLIEHDGHFWIVMELLTGGNLSERIASRGPLPPGACIEMALAIASALEYAHGRGIVHRDVKPMNVLFTDDDVLKLTDFGNAKLRDSVAHTQEGQLLGSPAYMSPEQITGAAIDARTDIYALGVSLYQMLTGAVPFLGDLKSVLAQHVNAEPKPPSAHVAAISPDLDGIVLRMLSKSPEDRYQDCTALTADLTWSAKCDAV